ncbi:MAG TPA: hypothetical protein VFJ19_04230 [Nocardioidaceae bacterium]|nr:hypothetical protein [Nocardioidaceae bacterium]
MRKSWLPLSASALVVGAMALVFGSLLNPSSGAESTLQTIHTVREQGARWLAMAVMYFGASLGLALGMPALLTLLPRRGRGTGITGIGLFGVGIAGTAGFAMLMVFFRALVTQRALKPHGLTMVAGDPSLIVMLAIWIGGFYAGALLISIALFMSRRTPTWVPVLLLVFVVMMPIAPHLGRVGQAVQVLALGIGFTGVAVSAISEQARREVARERLV